MELNWCLEGVLTLFRNSLYSFWWLLCKNFQLFFVVKILRYWPRHCCSFIRLLFNPFYGSMQWFSISRKVFFRCWTTLLLSMQGSIRTNCICKVYKYSKNIPIVYLFNWVGGWKYLIVKRWITKQVIILSIN